ncbi:RNI-like protein [Piromyces finnis]|uniref:RNI-like protein n=1 Tax=Piromyces finnis TaxID=1754191 RepID=A0A1Y1VBN6_9FUNG|nr:RNI-like protein [Piromyces finnis]|eukprot:ORX51478.1 RNI-like protein [Piromyces finnis]
MENENYENRHITFVESRTSQDQIYRPLTVEEEENYRPRMGILLNGRQSTNLPSPLQLPPLSVHSDEELNRIVHERQNTIGNSFRLHINAMDSSNLNFQNSNYHYSLVSNDSDDDDEEGPRSLLINHFNYNNDNDDEDSDIDSEEEEIRHGGRRALLFNNNNDNSNDNEFQQPADLNNSMSANHLSSNITFVERQEEIPVEDIDNNNRRRHTINFNNFAENDEENNNNNNEENDIIDEINIVQEVENHHAEQEARNEDIQNENFGIHCKYLNERLINKSLSWTLNLCLSSLQSKFTFEYDEFLNLLYKYERIRDENIFDKNLFLLKMNIEYYQKRFQSYKRQLIYIMSACRNLLIISDDPYYNNFDSMAEENRHARHHLNEATDNEMYNTILNPESVASIRNLLSVLSHSFLKIEKYDKDLFARDNHYVSSNILTNDHHEKNEMNKISLNYMPRTTMVNSMICTIKMKEEKSYVSNKNKGKVVEVKENEEQKQVSLERIPSEDRIENKLNTLSIHENLSSSTVSIDLYEVKESSSYSLSTPSFHDYFNLDLSVSDKDLFLNKNKLHNNALLQSFSSVNSLEQSSSSSIVNDITTTSKEKIPSKIQNFPPEILVKIFRYVRINQKNIKNKTKHCSLSPSSDISTASSSSPSMSDQTNDNNSNSSGINLSESNETISNNEDQYSGISEDQDHDSKTNPNNYNALYNCIRVCRHWRYLAQKELYHTLSFNYVNIINSYLLLKIAASLEVICKSEKISPTRTIVLRVTHDGKVPDSKDWYDRKGELAFNMILRNCPNLKYIALFGVNFSNLTAEVISSVCTNVQQLLFIPFSKSNISECSLLHITEHCHNIHSLILSFFSFSSKASIKKIFKNLEPSLKNLDLIQVECEEDDFNYIIPYLKNVEELGLMLTTSFSDSSLKLINRYCSKLEYLNFTGLINITDQGLENLFAIGKDSTFMNENLSSNISNDFLFKYRFNGYTRSHGHPKNSRVKRINLSDCIDITDDGLKIIADYCEALEAISIDDCPRITDEGFEAFIKPQSKIKYLSIANSEALTNKSIDCLNTYCPNIEKLNIKGCFRITEKTIRNFISHHPNLNTICFTQERNIFSRAFIDYLNTNFSTEDFDDMFLKWNQ